MVKGPRSARHALTLLRRATRAKGLTVEQVVNLATGKPRGKGSHEVWAVHDGRGTEIARRALAKHPGEMSWTVTRTFEEAFQQVLGEGWMDR